MKKIKGKQTLMRRKEKIKQINVLLTFLFFLVVLAVSSNIIYAENSIENVSLKQWDNPKEYTADVDKSGRIFWCGKDTLALVKRLERNKTALVFYKNDLTEAKEDIVDISMSDYQGLSCSGNAQYIYYTHQADDGTNRYFGYYDRKSKKFHKAFSFNKDLPTYKTNNLISPSHNYIAGPKGIEKIFLPGIGYIKVISTDILLEGQSTEKKLSYYDLGVIRVPYDLAWDYSEQQIYLLNRVAQTISIVDMKTLQGKNTLIRKIDKYDFTEVMVTSNSGQLFISAYTLHDPQQFSKKNVYFFDLTNKKEQATLFLENIDYFNSSKNIFVFSKTYGAREIADGIIYDDDASKRYVSISLIDENLRKKELKKINFSTTLNSSHILLPHGQPIINKNGTAVAFVNAREKKIHVIQSK